ncbi:MAG: hypothetical protein ACI4SS_05105 [Clostridia bacterium]
MGLFKKNKPFEGHIDDGNVAMESSICTGETLIGFKNSQSGKLEKAVVVRCQGDIDEFYIQHDLKNSGRIKWRK